MKNKINLEIGDYVGFGFEAFNYLYKVVDIKRKTFIYVDWYGANEKKKIDDIKLIVKKNNVIEVNK